MRSAGVLEPHGVLLVPPIFASGLVPPDSFRTTMAPPDATHADPISVKGGAAAWPYTLDEPSQGRIAVRLTLGTDRPWCAEGRGSVDVVNEFVAERDAPPPPTCPPMP